MVLDKLADSMRATLQKIAKSVFVDDKLLNELIKDIQRALLAADVNVQLVFDLSKTIKERAQNEAPPAGLTKREQLINIVYEELVRFLGGEKSDLALPDQKPATVALVGLFGSGKTTTAGKLGLYFSKRGKRVALLGLDVHRPAAMDQLRQVGAQVKVPVFIDKTEKNPVKIYEACKDKLADYDVVIIDTAGRDALSEDLIQELREVHDTIEPDETLLVISADIGQAARTQAQAFHDSCGITGVIVTKMDGTARGGGALSACSVTKSPIKFIGVGEKLDDLEPFNPKGFVGRLLGMGDLQMLLEKAKEAITEEEAKDIEKRLIKGEFNLLDLYQQMEALAKMGSIGKLMEMIPGMGQLKLPKEALQVQEGKLKKWRILMDSMTKAELEDPDIIAAPRMERIAKGAGMPVTEVRDLLKQYQQTKKMMKMLKGGSPEKLMQKLGAGKLKMKR